MPRIFFLILPLIPLTAFAECEELTPVAKTACMAAIEPARELASTYQHILDGYDRESKTDSAAPIKKKALMASQEAWIRFRDANCDAVAQQFHGGTAMLGSSVNCTTQHDKARTQQQLDEFVPHS